MFIFQILLPVLLHLATASYNSGICKQPSSQGTAHPFPSLPDSSEAHIEMKLLTKNSTVIIREFFDKRSNQSALWMKRRSSEVNLYLRFNTNELVNVSSDRSTCKASTITASNQRFLFGAGSILQLGTGGVQVYQGQDTVRGINVEKWYSCQYWPDIDATMNVTWYFSDAANWDTALGLQVAPIRAWVKGHVGSGSGANPHDFEHIYDVYHFNDFITVPDAFQIPDLAYCPGRQINKTFPKLPTAFSMTSEMVGSLENTISYVKQWFDTQMGLVKHIYRTKQGSDWTAEIHDYKSGVAYITDLKLGNCTCVPIERGDNDNIATDNRHVRMMTPREFLQMNSTNITYLGVRSARQISSDVFVAERFDYPPFSPVRTIWEWHFTRINETSLSPGTPIKMILYMPALGQSITYNLFDLVTTKIDMTIWDINACYNNLPRRIFQFSVPGNYSQKIQVNPPLFKYGVRISIILLTVTSPLRIVNIRLQYSKNVLVTFDMLDVPPVAGDVAGNITQTPLDVAADLLTKSFKEFFIYYPYNGEPYDVPAIPSSLMEITVGQPPVSVSSTPTKQTTPTSTPSPTLPLGPDQSTVNPNTPLPSMPVSYEVHIKRVVSEANMSIETHEIYNQTSGQLSLRTTARGVVSLTIIDTNKREVHTIDPKQKTCKVSNLPSGGLDTVIGYTQDKTGKGEIISVAGALVYGVNRSYQYQGREVIRGVNCLKWSLLNVTLGGDIHNNMDIMWYFSDPYTWDTALNWPWAPIRASVVGRDDRVTPNLYYENVYDFIHFKNFIQVKGAFETPDLVTCPGRTPVKTFPLIAGAASFTTEALDRTLGVITHIKEWFDTQLKISKYVYTPTPAMNSSYGAIPLTEVHDFNTGVAYVIDNIRGNCTSQPIETTSFDETSKNSIYVRMKTGAQFFSTDVTNYTYEGTDMVRDIPADRFVAKRSDYPPRNPRPSTFEWRFSTGDYSRIQETEAMYSRGVPLQMIISIPLYNLNYIYNIYNYVQAKPDPLTWDIRSCYLNLNRRRFQVSFPGNYTKQISTDQLLFKYAALNSLTTYMGISPLRISEIKLDFAKDVIFSFTLLDVAPLHGDVNKTVKETPLNTAAGLLRTAIHKNEFVIPLDTDSLGDVLNISPIPSSLKEIDEGPEATAAPVTQPVTVKHTATPTPLTPAGHTAKTHPPVSTHFVTNDKSSTPVNPLKGTTIAQKTPVHLPGSTSANALCGKDGGRYSTGVVVAVCVVMVVAGGVVGTGLAIFVKRKRGNRWSQL